MGLVQRTSLFSGSTLALTLGLLAAACGGTNPGNDTQQTDATDTMVSGDGGLPSDFFTPPAPPFTMTTNTPLSVQVSASGEDLAQRGFDYSATPGPDEPVFVDGWEVRFDRYIVVLANVRLNRPGVDPSMRNVVGELVAQNAGPMIVDVTRMGPIVGAGGAPETAQPLAVFDRPMNGNFDPTVRYAFSYDTVAATTAMRNVNLTSADREVVERMLTRNWSHFFSGTATYRGRAASATVDPAFRSYPTSVRFEFGFRAPTSYLNCHNPELGAEDIPANRGIQPSMTGAVRAQVTLHTDHFFWDQANVEGTPLHFDMLAARVQGFGSPPTMGMSHLVTMDDLMGVNPAMLVDRMNMPVLDRGAQTMGYSGMGPLVFQVNGAMGVNDLRSFVATNAQAQGHLNSDGLCFVQPNGALGF